MAIAWDGNSRASWRAEGAVPVEQVSDEEQERVHIATRLALADIHPGRAGAPRGSRPLPAGRGGFGLPG